ncbi:MAG TPA: glutamine--fructose-6-phosphate transaminase (isomerizing), partial [Lachnospiraceae bacterium]|nr:glutamine--fructose-6-phosphate transaminase (isomerizing) [Lachnospiraceae bacterium]
MCGIVGYIGNRDCTDVLIDALSKLEYRGYDSAGIAVFEKGTIKVEKCKGKLENLTNLMKIEGRPSGNCGIGHTRWATHGEPSDINSHPHGNKRVSIVHNGIIENYRELKEFLSKEGYAFESETDTEVVAKLLDYYYNNDPIDTIIKVLADIEGAYSLGIIFRDFPEHIYAVRKDSPLIVGLGEDENFIASDVPAILKYTRNYYLLNQDEICDITRTDVKICNVRRQTVKKEVQTANWDIDAAEKNGYEHFMLKEIHEQPSAVKMTVSPRIKNGLPDLSETGLTPEKLSAYNHIFIVACGTAMHAGMVGKYVIEKLARVGVTVDIASEFRYRDPLICENDLLIVISQSGETADTKAALELGKERGADTLAVVNVVGSSIAREADMVLYTNAGPEISVASTKAYSVQIAAMYLFAFELALVKEKISEDECREYVQALCDVPDLIEKTLETKELCQMAASKLL